MSWHYQVQEYEEGGQVYYGIVEAYPDLGAVTDPVKPYGETVEELRAELRNMLNDIDRFPVRPKQTTIDQLDPE